MHILQCLIKSVINALLAAGIRKTGRGAFIIRATLQPGPSAEYQSSAFVFTPTGQRRGGR